MTILDRDLFDLSDPEYDLTGIRLVPLRLALYRRERRRREASSAKPSIVRWFMRHLERRIV